MYQRFSLKSGSSQKTSGRCGKHTVRCRWNNNTGPDSLKVCTGKSNNTWPNDRAMKNHKNTVRKATVQNKWKSPLFTSHGHVPVSPPNFIYKWSHAKQDTNTILSHTYVRHLNVASRVFSVTGQIIVQGTSLSGSRWKSFLRNSRLSWFMVKRCRT